MPLGLLPCYRNLTHYKIRKKEKEKTCFTQFSTRIHWNRILDASKLFHINEVLYIPLSCMFECMFENVCLSKYVWVSMFEYVCSSTYVWVQIFEKGHSSKRKNEQLPLLASFTAKLQLVFVLIQENAFSERFYFEANRKSTDFTEKRY